MCGQLANRFHVAESTSHLIIRNCLTNLNKIAHTFIKWPAGQWAIDTVEKFNCLRPDALQNVIGAIDWCHIKILAPWVGIKKNAQVRHYYVYKPKTSIFNCFTGIKPINLKKLVWYSLIGLSLLNFEK